MFGIDHAGSEPKDGRIIARPGQLVALRFYPGQAVRSSGTLLIRASRFLIFGFCSLSHKPRACRLVTDETRLRESALPEIRPALSRRNSCRFFRRPTAAIPDLADLLAGDAEFQGPYLTSALGFHVESSDAVSGTSMRFYNISYIGRDLNSSLSWWSPI